MGHPVEIFLTPPADSSTCPICRDVLEDAVSMKECGHTFCDECAEACLRSKSCPACRVVVTGTNPNFYARESIGSMQVKCLNGHCIGENEDQNCTWTGRCEDATTIRICADSKLLRVRGKDVTTNA
jgi:hypothetical protein